MSKTICSLFFLFLFLFSSCTFKDSITLQSIDGLSLDIGEAFNPELTVQATFHNSSLFSLTLQQLQLVFFINDAKLATVNETLNLKINAQSDFMIPLTIMLSFEDSGLLGTILSLTGEQQYTIQCRGHAVLYFWGFSIEVPISYIKNNLPV